MFRNNMERLAAMSPADARSRGELRAHYQALRSVGRLHGSITRALRVRKTRDVRQSSSMVYSLIARLQRSHVAIPLGQWQQESALRIAQSIYPRRKNWGEIIASNQDFAVVRVLSINNGRYSSRCTYMKWTYDIQVSSWGFVTVAGLQYHYRGKTVLLPHPHGYRWGADSMGIRLVSLSNGEDYHPDGSDLMHDDGKPATLRSLTAKVRHNAAMRREQKRRLHWEAKTELERERAIQRAECEGCCICVADSVEAGNCRAGTESWARRHHLDPRRHYRPSEVLAAANGDTNRVAIVVAVAVRRHCQEMRQGYCILRD